jgi:hypothetical protein
VAKTTAVTIICSRREVTSVVLRTLVHSVILVTIQFDLGAERIHKKKFRIFTKKPQISRKCVSKF